MPDWKTVEAKDSLTDLTGFGWNHAGGHNTSGTPFLAVAGVTVTSTNYYQITNTEAPQVFLPDDAHLVFKQRLHASDWWLFGEFSIHCDYPDLQLSAKKFSEQNWMFALLLYLDHRAKGLFRGENCNVRGRFCLGFVHKPVNQTALCCIGLGL